MVPLLAGANTLIPSAQPSTFGGVAVSGLVLGVLLLVYFILTILYICKGCCVCYKGGCCTSCKELGKKLINDFVPTCKKCSEVSQDDIQKSTPSNHQESI
jgi:hypothetical protein